MRFQETVLGRLGKALHVEMDDITHEALPHRWVDLILYLEEQEKKRSAPEPVVEPRGVDLLGAGGGEVGWWGIVVGGY